MARALVTLALLAVVLLVGATGLGAELLRLAGNPGLALVLGFLNAPEYRSRFVPP